VKFGELIAKHATCESYKEKKEGRRERGRERRRRKRRREGRGEEKKKIIIKKFLENKGKIKGPNT
jgi:hypothetical protein